MKYKKIMEYFLEIKKKEINQYLGGQGIEKVKIL